MMKFRVAIVAVIVALIGCKSSDHDVVGQPGPLPPPAIKMLPPVGSKDDIPIFPLAESDFTEHQQKYDENTVSVYFKAGKADLNDEQSVNGLTANDLIVTENSKNVFPFTVQTAKEVRQTETVDIMFLVDITGTMTTINESNKKEALIETVKRRAQQFIATSSEEGYHTRMCFSTFGDYTVKKCTRFFDNTDPELVSELNSIHAYRGEGQDPGWPDLDENPMRALIDASEAPWGKDSQRFVILITDWGFLYLPNRPGDKSNPGYPEYAERNRVPRFGEVIDAIKSSQMKVFAVTRMKHTHKGKNLVWDGYNTPFQGEPSIREASGGEWIDFDKLLKQPRELDRILRRILNRIDTTYKLTYVVDRVQGLDPSLPVSQRNVEIKTKVPNRAIIRNISTSSSIPTGSPEYQTTWELDSEPVLADTVHVFLDGSETPLDPKEYTVSGGKITFKTPPKAGAKIRVTYLHEAMAKNLRLQPISLPGKYNARNTEVYLNGIRARTEELIFSPDLEGRTNLSFAPSVTSPSDPYKILEKRGLKVQLSTKR